MRAYTVEELIQDGTVLTTSVHAYETRQEAVVSIKDKVFGINEAEVTAGRDATAMNKFVREGGEEWYVMAFFRKDYPDEIKWILRETEVGV